MLTRWSCREHPGQAMLLVAGEHAIQVPDRAVRSGDSDVGFETRQRATAPCKLTRSQRFRNPSDQAMAKGGAATALVTFDDDPTIEVWMVLGVKPGAEIADFCTSERGEIGGNDRTVVQLAWGKRGGTTFFCHGEGV